MKPFVHLHTHSQYSLLNGAMSMKDLLKRVGEYGMSSVAITDEHNMFGAVDFQLKAKKAQLKPIFGTEVKLVHSCQQISGDHDDRIVLLAKDQEGYAT